MQLAEATSSDTAGSHLVLVPIGSLEQHGPHLPLDTDTVVAKAVAAAAGEELDAWVAPAIAYGSSGEHQSFPGTVSIGTDALRHTVVELVRSLSTWADRVLLVNGHGGNVAALAAAVDQLVVEGHDVAWVPCAEGSIDLHAGRSETSLMLHLSPWTVRLHRAEAGDTNPLEAILPRLRAGGVEAVSGNGVLGDPNGANAAEGARVFDAMVRSVVRIADDVVSQR
ncbi:mycofactocin biosynthesis peptidyl-dipeptidase MftE [soil metagenome]